MRRWERIPEPRLDPEEALIAAQDEGYVDTQEQEVLSPVLAKLPAVEGRYVTLRLRGRTEEAIAQMYGVTQQSVSKRLRRAELRLRWIEGPGTWFTSSELIDASKSAGCVRTDAALVGTYWATTSLMAAARSTKLPKEAARHHTLRVRQILAERAWSSTPALARFAIGLGELSSWGRELLWIRPTTYHPGEG